MKKILFLLMSLLAWCVLPSEALATINQQSANSEVTVQNPKSGQLKKALKGHDLSNITSLAFIGDVELTGKDFETFSQLVNLEALDLSKATTFSVHSYSSLSLPKLKTIVTSCAIKRDVDWNLPFVDQQVSSNALVIGLLKGYIETLRMYETAIFNGHITGHMEGLNWNTNDEPKFDLSNVEKIIYKTTDSPESTLGDNDLKVWTGTNTKFTPSINLAKGTITFERTTQTPSFSDYQVYVKNPSVKPIELPQLKNAVYIDDDVFKIGNLHDISFPATLRYLGNIEKQDDRDSIGSIVFERSSDLLIIHNTTAHFHSSKINDIVFNRPVLIDKGTFWNTEVNRVVFEDAAYLCNEAFSYVNSLYFKTIPSYLDKGFVSGIIDSKSQDKRFYETVYIPSNSLNVMSEKYRDVIDKSYYKEQ